VQCAYAAVRGPGVIMHVLCFLAALISTATGLAAVGILWAIPTYNSAGGCNIRLAAVPAL
jgi:hypothetical protein